MCLVVVVVVFGCAKRPCGAPQVRSQHPRLSPEDVVRKTLQQVEGAYAVCFMFADRPDVLIGARKASPLILGIGRAEHGEEKTDSDSDSDPSAPAASLVKECFLASDASAIIEYTNKVCCCPWALCWRHCEARAVRRRWCTSTRMTCA